MATDRAQGERAGAAGKAGTAGVRPATGSFAVTVRRRLPGWSVWALSALLVAASGSLLYLSRGRIAETLKASQGGGPGTPVETAGAAPGDPLGQVLAIPPRPAPPAPPELSAAEVLALLEPLPAEVVRLAEEGRSELPEFAELGSSDATREQVMRNRWQAWGRIWRNRTRVIRQRAPPLEACWRRPQVSAACLELEVALGLLESITEVEDVELAARTLDDARFLAERLAESLAVTPGTAAGSDG